MSDIIFLVLGFPYAIYDRVLPVVSIAGFPLIGSHLVSAFTTTGNALCGFYVTVPYVYDLFYIFFWVIIPFEIGLGVLRVVLGNRSPVLN